MFRYQISDIGRGWGIGLMLVGIEIGELFRVSLPGLGGEPLPEATT
jgi:hypothetical protein